jgi:hypothetical protein
MPVPGIRVSTSRPAKTLMAETRPAMTTVESEAGLVFFKLHRN